MQLYQPTITGSLSVSGSINISGSINVVGGGGTITGTASYATNADLLDGLDSTVFTLTSSFAAQTASFTAFTASILSYTASQNILNGTYTLTSSFAAQTASFTAFTSSVNTFTASQLVLNGTYATTSSNTFTGIQTVNSNLIVTGSITAQTLVVQTVTSSIIYSSGSNIFGNLSANTQTFTGSILTSGNIGLGITPSAWNGIYKVLQIDAGSISSSPSYNNISVGANVFYNAGNSPRYIVSDYATLYGQDDGLHAWYTAPSGTAGAAMTFTQSMTLTAAGNLGIGTTNPTQALAVYKGGASNYLSIQGDNNASYDIAQQFTDGTNSVYSGMMRGSTGTTGSYTIYTGGAPRINVTSDGNVGIGTTSPSSQAAGATTGILDVSAAAGGNLVLHRTSGGDTALFSILKASNGTYIDSTGAATAANNAIYFRTNNINADQISLTSSLTITSGGNVLIGTTSNSTGNPTFYIQNKAGLVANIAGFNFSSTTTAENANNNILSTGAYYNGAATTATQTSATLYQQSSGAHTFYTNNGLTAGNNYTATERMIITNAGLVGIGTVSPNVSYKLTLSGVSSGVVAGLALVDTEAYSFSVYSAASALLFRDVTNGAERLRVTSIGDLCSMRTVSGVAGGASYKNLSWGAAGLMAREAYDSYLVGNLYYDGSWKLKYAGYYGNCLNNYDGQYVFQTATTNGAADSVTGLTATFSLDRSGNAIFKGSVTQNGSPSDINLKENLVKITSPLEKISQINGYNFNWKAGTPSNGLVISVPEGMQAPESPLSIVHDAGLIAQEVEAVMPQLVRDNGHKALNYNGIIALLVEGIKELKAEFDAYKTTHP